MLTFNYWSPYFWDKNMLTKFISGCRMVWDLICGTSWFYKSKTEKVTGDGKSAILSNCCCLLSKYNSAVWPTVVLPQPTIFSDPPTDLRWKHSSASQNGWLQSFDMHVCSYVGFNTFFSTAHNCVVILVTFEFCMRPVYRTFNFYIP